MTILYLDTSSSFLYAGIVKDDSLLASVNKNFGHDLSTNTLNEIRVLLEENNLSPTDVDKIITVNGPGSFTGIRIGLTIAKTYAWSLKKDIIVISSLEAMALSSSNHDYYIPLIDARRGYVYAGIYNKNYEIELKDQYIKLEDLIKKCDCLENKIFISNDNIELNKESYTPDILKIVNHVKSRKSINPHSVDAAYLKLTEAEENKQKSE